MPRHSNWLTACLLICVSTCQGRPWALQAPAPTVTLDTGTLEGAPFGPGQNGVAFVGVPYATPPVGDLRWKPPQPLRKRNGTRQATHFGAPCPQLPAGWLPYIAGNEDCLYLNVWTPQLSANAKLPVLVCLHGGGNSAGYSQMTPLGPTLSQLSLVCSQCKLSARPFWISCLPSSHRRIRPSLLRQLWTTRPTAGAQMDT
jgi:para-nitrobenzyl esterase